MTPFFDPTPAEKAALDALARELPGIQQTLVSNHDRLAVPDRGAHQQQLAAGRVLLTLERALPAALDGLGVFHHDGGIGPHHVGIGRISTGLGCPHAETDPDFLGLMVAFRTKAGHRVDFITINDPTSPTDTPEEFIALLKATADASGATGLLANQAALLLSLSRHAGVRAPSIALHVTRQTLRTVRANSAYEQYWTGIVRARDVLGKFTFVPTHPRPPRHQAGRGPHHLSDEWRAGVSVEPRAFELHWIPFVNSRDTPLSDLTRPWRDDHKVLVGTVVFPRIDPDTRDAKLVALLASELGANPGNWEEVADGSAAALPATRFTASRSLAYRASQAHRHALPEDDYASFFERGEIADDLARELVRRYHEKRAAGHAVPPVGEVQA